MPTATVSLFINPAAGRGRAARRLVRITELLEQSRIAVDVRQSRAVGDLEEQTYMAVCDGIDKIIVAGGDGSIHEAVNGIMRADGSAALGIVPTGTGNDFAKACSIPLDWQHATQLLAERIAKNTAMRRIDIGCMNDRYFANGAGIGFDAKVTRIARSYQWPVGDIVYLLAVFRCMIDGIATPDMRIVADHQCWSGPVTLANVSNGPWIGGMFHIAPMADNTDAKLELLIADPVSRLRLLTLLPKLMRGEHFDEQEVNHASVTKVTVDARAPVPSHLDGEVQPLQTRFEIEVLPGALNLL